ncbi:MAG: helix-hairpin-helix domain-containing protein [Candidatus Omnitrophica bacterium]|nr:helix-hairpin-helix domain-containing protein [Candidatus Omnitrophota bacterium]
MLELTKQEKQVIIFLITSALLGSGILCYRNLRRHPKIEIVSDKQIAEEIREHKVVNINTATEGELVRLKGVGPSLAKAIIEYRAIQGAFKNKEELKNVKGIGQSKYEEIKDHIKIE